MADYVEDIVGLGKQAAAGLLTIPSEALRAASVVASPNRFLRQLRGEATQDDKTGVAATLQGWGDRWNEGVNELVGVNDPSPLDNTAQFAARMLGGAIPVAPLKAISTAVANAPLLVRGGVGLLEAMTPLTFTSNKGLATLPAVATNVGVQTAVAGGAQAALEPRDPTQVYEKYDAEGNLVEAYYPGEGQLPGAGRVAARSIQTAIQDHPVAAGVGAATAAGLGVLGYRGLRNVRAQQAAQATSDVVQPIRPVDTDVPVTNIPINIGGVNVPLTSGLRQAGYRIAEVAADANIVAKDAVEQSLRAAGQPPEEARAIASIIDQVNEVHHKDRVLSALEDGILVSPAGEKRTIKIGRLGEALEAASQRDPDIRRKVDDQIAMETELDNRKYAANRGETVEVMPGTNQPPIPGYIGPLVRITPRATLHDIDDAELVRRVRAGRADRLVQAFVRPYNQFMHDFADFIVDWGGLSRAERGKWLNANPHYMPTINLDEPKSHRVYRFRDHLSGPKTAGDAFLAATEYVNNMLAFVYRNKARDSIVTALQQGGGGAFGNSKWLGRVLDPADLRRRTIADPSAPNGVRPVEKSDFKLTGDKVSFYRNGELVDVEVRNKSLYNSMMAMPRHTSTLLGVMRQLAQSGMTGKIATLIGQPFVVANAFMGAMFGQVTRPKGYSFGLGDKLLQSATGGRVGLRGDPTAYIGMTTGAVRDIGAVLGRALSDTIYNSMNAGGVLGKLPGAEATADFIARKYVNSNVARMHRAGAGHASTLGESDWDVGGRMSVLGAVAPHYDAARSVSTPQSYGEWVKKYGREATPAALKQGWRVFSDIQQAIGSMAQSYIFRSNYGKVTDAARISPEAAYKELEKLTAVTQQLLGDPAQMGSGLRDMAKAGSTRMEKITGRAIDMTPYANISVQALARIVRAARENPMGTATAFALTLGPMVILPLAEGIKLDNERMAQGLDPIYIPWEFNRPDWHATRFVSVPIRGVPPDHSPEYRLDPLMSLLYTIGREIFIERMGLRGDPRSDPALGYSRDAILRIAEERSAQNVYTAAVNTQPFSQFPPWLGAIFAATGIELPPLERLISRGAAQPITVRGMGGYEDTRLAHDVYSTRVEQFIGHVFGSAGLAVSAMLSAGWQSERREAGTFAGRAVEELGGRARARLPEFAPLWEQPKNRATSEPTAQMVNEREATMMRIREGISAAKIPGTLGSGRYAEPGTPGGGSQGVTDPQMRVLLNSVNNFYSTVSGDGGLIGARNKVRRMILDVRQEGLPYVQEREKTNALAAEVVRINRELLALYTRFEDQVSNRLGYRIRLQDIDPTKPITQFSRLPNPPVVPQ